MFNGDGHASVWLPEPARVGFILVYIMSVAHSDIVRML